jgi:hypothetical protein
MEFESSKEWDSPARDIRRKWDIPTEPRMNRLFLAAMLLTLTAAGAEARAACQRSPHLVGKCFQVHGRLLAYNGTPTFRIWPVGSHRLLGVNGASGVPDDADEADVDFVHAILPRSADLFATSVYGDYLVCPFTSRHPGRMQFVCIARAARLVEIKRESGR